MFMRHNRAVNNFHDPAQDEEQAAHRQGAYQLDPNPSTEGRPVDLRFAVNLSSPEEINEGHYQGGVKGSGPYKGGYEQHIFCPAAAVPPKSSIYKLKSR
jgi:hypothetical protein